jgi:membrane protease YdiL (CAAX protease family)
MTEPTQTHEEQHRTANQPPPDDSEANTIAEGGLRAVGVAIGLLLLSLITTTALTVPILFLTEISLSSSVLNAVLTSAGFLAVVIGYLVISGRGTSYLDIGPLSRQAGLAVLALIIGLAAVQVVIAVIGEGSQVTQRPKAPGTLLAMLSIAATIVPVAEELFFRNLLQKRLAEALPAWGAIGMTSFFFAIVHLGGFVSSPTAVDVGLLQVFGSALLLGYVYHRTENLSITIAGHAGFNSMVYALSLLRAAGLLPGFT